MARFYADENFTFGVAVELRKLGHDVLTCYEAGNASLGIPDDKVLQFAINQQRLLLTQNRRHFWRLHKVNSGHFGIVACRYDPDYPRQAARIIKQIDATGNAAGQFIRVNRPHPTEG